MNLFVYTVLLLAIIIGIIVGIRKVMTLGTFTFTMKRNFLLGYLAAIVFIGFLMMVFLLPKIEPEVLGSSPQSVPDIYSLVLDESEKEDLPGQFIKEEWTMSPNSDVIDLNFDFEDGFYMNVVVEEHDETNAEVTLFETPTLVGDIDISNEIPLIRFNVENDDEITMDNVKRKVNVKFYNIANDVIYNQFTDAPNRNWQHEIFNFEVGEQLLYISVPKNVTIESSFDDYIHYVNE